MTLRDFLFLPRKWAWGGVGGEDCTTFCASWVLEATGKDPSIGIRGTYATAEDANDILHRAGGVEAFVASRLESLGFRKTHDPIDGDIGIVTGETVGGFKSLPAIRFGPLWAVMAPRGAVIKKLDHTAAWRIK